VKAEPPRKKAAWPAARQASQEGCNKERIASWGGAIGVTPAGMKRRKLRVAIIRQSYQFLRELRAGELVRTRSGVVAVGESISGSYTRCSTA
jgi:hypothetical protein